MNTRTLRTGAAILFVTVALALSGCAAIDDAVNRQATHTYDSKDRFDAGAPVDAGWIPADAAEITLRTPAEDAGDVAVILLVSDSELPESCSEAERQSAPMLSIDGAPDVYKEIYAKASPFQRYGRAEEVAAVVAFLCSPEASWVSGAHILANGAANM